MKNIAIPVNANQVSTVMDFCTNFLIVESVDNKLISRVITECNSDDLLYKLRALNRFKVNIVICCKISNSFRRMLELNNIELICNIFGNIDEVLDAYFSGEIQSKVFCCKKQCRKRRRGNF